MSYEMAHSPPKKPSRGTPLSPREREVLEALAKGWTNNQIADALAITPDTVKNHVQYIFLKLGVTNRTQAALHWIKSHKHT